MKKYYAERNGLINNSITLSLKELNIYFLKTYNFFSIKGYFECAEKGVWQPIPYSNDETLIIPPTLSPSPEIFFITHLQDKQIWPIYEFAEY